MLTKIKIDNMGFGNFLNSRMATQQAQGGVPTSGFGSNMKQNGSGRFSRKKKFETS